MIQYILMFRNCLATYNFLEYNINSLIFPGHLATKGSLKDEVTLLHCNSTCDNCYIFIYKDQ